MSGLPIAHSRDVSVPRERASLLAPALLPVLARPERSVRQPTPGNRTPEHR